MNTAGLVSLGVTFRKEFQNLPSGTALWIQQRRKSLSAAGGVRCQCGATERWDRPHDDLPWTEKDHECLTKRDRSALSRLTGGATEVAKFMEAPLLVNTRKQRVKRRGGDVKNMDGADLNNQEELMSWRGARVSQWCPFRTFTRNGT